MKNQKYDNDMPLSRLEEGDKTIIKVNKFNPCIVKEKDRAKYQDVPNGI